MPLPASVRAFRNTDPAETVAWMLELDPGSDADPSDGIQIDTPEGTMTLTPGDWVIYTAGGHFYPMSPKVFETAYGPAAA